MPERPPTIFHGLVHPQVATVHDALALELEAKLLRQRFEQKGKEPTLHDHIVFLQQAEILVNARRRRQED